MTLACGRADDRTESGRRLRTATWGSWWPASSVTSVATSTPPSAPPCSDGVWPRGCCTQMPLPGTQSRQRHHEVYDAALTNRGAVKGAASASPSKAIAVGVAVAAVAAVGADPPAVPVPSAAVPVPAAATTKSTPAVPIPVPAVPPRSVVAIAVRAGPGAGRAFGGLQRGRHGGRRHGNPTTVGHAGKQAGRRGRPDQCGEGKSSDHLRNSLDSPTDGVPTADTDSIARSLRGVAAGPMPWRRFRAAVAGSASGLSSGSGWLGSWRRGRCAGWGASTSTSRSAISSSAATAS
jgi:hypothetical protein